MPVVDLILNDGNMGAQLDAHLQAVIKIDQRIMAMRGSIASVGKAWKDANMGVNDPLTKLAAATKASRVEAAAYQKALDAIVTELKAVKSALEQSGKGLRGQKKDTQDAAEKLALMARRTGLVNRLMVEHGVTAKSASSAVRAFGKDLDRAEREAGGYAVKIDRAEKKTLELAKAQRKAVSDALAMAAAERKAASAAAEAAAELVMLARRQEVMNRLMREHGVSAKSAATATRAYGKNIDKLGVEAAQLAKRLDTAQRETKELTSAQRAASASVSKGAGLVSTMTTRLIGMAAAYGGVRLAIAAVKAPSAAFGDVETSLRAVSKTTDIVGDDLAALGATVTGFSTGQVPILKTALLSIGAAAGQIGIEGRGNIEDQIFLFGQLSAAVDEIDPADAVREMAVLRNVQGESVDATKAQVNVLVRLGNELATGEAKILALASEVGRATSQFKIGSVEVLGFAGGLAAIGSKAEGGGTAIGRSMREIQSAVSEGGGALDEFARIARVSSDEFVKRWTEDPVKGFDTFLEGLATFGRDAGQELAKVGLGSDRLAKVLPVLATRLDVLRDSQARARDEAQILTAVNKEAAAAFDTQDKDLQRLTNTWLAQAEAIGSDVSPVLRAAAADWAFFIASADSEAIGTVIGGALGLLSNSVLFVAENVEVLIGAFAVFALLQVPAAVITLPVIVAAIETAVASLMTFLAANPILAPFVVATAAVLALNAAINVWSANSQRQIKAITAESDRLRGAITGIQDALRSGDTAQLESSLTTTERGIEDLIGQAEELRAKLATVFQDSATTGEGFAAQAKLKEELASVESQVITLTAFELKLNKALETSTDLTEEARKEAQALAKATSDQAKARKAAAVAEEKFIKLQKEATGITRGLRTETEQAFDVFENISNLIAVGAFREAAGQEALLRAREKGIALIIKAQQKLLAAERKSATATREAGEKSAASLVRVATLTGDAESVTEEALAAMNRYGVAIDSLPVGKLATTASILSTINTTAERLGQIQRDAKISVVAAADELIDREERRLAIIKEIQGLVEAGKTGEPEGISKEQGNELFVTFGVGTKLERIFDDLGKSLEALGGSLGGLVDSLFDIGDRLTEGGDGLAGAVVNAAGVFVAGGGAGRAIGTLAVGAASSSGFGQQTVSQFGGLTEGNFFKEGVEAGAQFGAVGIVIGGLVGSLIKKGADDLEANLREVLGRADLNITLADANLVELGQQIEENLENALNSIQSQLLADLDFDAAGLSIDVRGNEFEVIVGSSRRLFNSVDEALAFMIAGVLRANTTAALLGEEMEKLAKSSLGFEAQSIEDLQKGLRLAQELDFEDTKVNQAAIRVKQEQIQTAIRFNLTVEKVLALQRKRTEAEQQSLKAQAAGVLGASDFTSAISELVSGLEQFNATSGAEVEFLKERKRALEELIAVGQEEATVLQDTADSLSGPPPGTGDRFGKFFDDAADGNTTFVSTVQAATNAVIDSAEQLDSWQQEIDAINQSLSDRPTDFGQEEFAALWENAVGRASLSMIDLIRVVDGGGAFAEEEKEIRKALFVLQLAATISQAEILIATMEFVSDAMGDMFATIIAAGKDALDQVIAGAPIDFGDSGGVGRGGGGGRKEARENLVDMFAELRLKASGASDGMISLISSIEEFEEAQSEAARLGKIGADVLDQAFRDFLTVSAEAVLADFGDIIDQVNGVGEFSAALRDQTETFRDAREQLTILIALAAEQGESTQALIEQRRDLVEAEQLAAQQLVATNLVDELAALGVGLDPELLERMAEQEHLLAQQRAIDSVLTAAALGLLEGVDIAGLIMDITDSVRPDILTEEAEAAREMADGIQAAEEATRRISEVFLDLRRQAGPASDGLLSLRDRLQDFGADVREAAKLGTFSAEEISGAWEDFLSVSADVALRGVQGPLDAVRGVGLFEASLRDQTAQFRESRQQLNLLIRVARRNGVATDELISQRQDLAAAEELAARQLVGSELVSELDALGVALDPGVLREMEQSELNLMKVRAISSVAAAAAAGLLTEGVDELIGRIESVTLEDLEGADQASRFATLEELFASFAEGLEVSILAITDRFAALTDNAVDLNASQEQLLELRRLETQELSALADASLRSVQSELDAADGIGQLSAGMDDASARFGQVESDLRQVMAAISAAGGSTVELADTIRSLAGAERVTADRLATDLVGAISDLGIVLPVEQTQQLAAAQFQLAQMEILVALTTREFIDALARAGLDAGELLAAVIAGPQAGAAVDGGGAQFSRSGGSSSAGGGEDLEALRRDIEATLKSFRQARLGPTASAAAGLAQQLKDVQDKARRASFDLEKVAAAFAVARAEFVKTSLDAIGPAAGFNEAAAALKELEGRFVDTFAGLLIVEAGADALAEAGERLALAADQIEDSLKEGIRQRIADLEAVDPTATNQEVFLASQARFEELAATAQDMSLTNAERAAALEQLAGASSDFEDQIKSFLVAGPTAGPLLDQMLETLRAVNAADILVVTDRDILEAQAASLAQIDLTTAAQPTSVSQASSFSGLSSSVDGVAAAIGGGLLDPGLIQDLIDAFDAEGLTVAELSALIVQIGAIPFQELTTALADSPVAVADTIAGLASVLGAGAFADVVTALGALGFADLVIALNDVGLDVVDLAAAVGAEGFLALSTSLDAISLAGITADFGVDALAGFTNAISASTLDFSDLSFDEIVRALGPFGGIAAAIGAENFQEIVDSLEPINTNTLDTATDTGMMAVDTGTTATQTGFTAGALTAPGSTLNAKMIELNNNLKGGQGVALAVTNVRSGIGTGSGADSLQSLLRNVGSFSAFKGTSEFVASGFDSSQVTAAPPPVVTAPQPAGGDPEDVARKLDEVKALLARLLKQDADQFQEEMRTDDAGRQVAEAGNDISSEILVEAKKIASGPGPTDRPQ